MIVIIDIILRWCKGSGIAIAWALSLVLQSSAGAPCNDPVAALLPPLFLLLHLLLLLLLILATFLFFSDNLAFSVSTALLPLSPAGADDPPPPPPFESNGVCCQQTEPCVVTERERRAVTPGSSQPPHNQQPPLSLQFTFTILRLTNLPPKHHQRQTNIDKKGILRSKLPNGSTTLFSSFCSIFSKP